MKMQSLLGATAVFAMGLVTSNATAAPTCWGLVTSPGNPGGSCCWEERQTSLGSPTGTNVVQAPSIITDDGGTSYDVFAQGWDNAVWTRHFDGTTWGGWSSLGGVTTSRPTGVAASAGHVFVFARGSDNAVWYRDRTASTWGPWRTLGGHIVGGVGAAAWSSGEVEIYAHGSDHALWKNSIYAGTAGGWSSLGGTLYGEPGAGHVTYADGGGEGIQVWVMHTDRQVWRRKHERVPRRMGYFTMMMDLWTGWGAQLTGTTGGLGFVEDSEPGFVQLAGRDSAGTVFMGFANATGVTMFSELFAPIKTRSDVSIAAAAPGEEHYAFVDRDTAMVHEFHHEQVCSSCGDGRCYGAENCGSCPGDCGSCGPTCNNGVCEAGESCSTCANDCGTCTPPPTTCQDYSFCVKASLTATTGIDVKGFGCTIGEARTDATKKVIGGVLFDGMCPPAPSVCDGGTPWAVAWCCKDTGTTWEGIGCSKDEADEAAKRDDSCESWATGICD